MKIGSLFTGFGGLDLAVEQAFDAETVWTSDIDPGACKIIAHRFPGIPNLGDVTKIDWSQVEPVDIITGGFPCQDLSPAGKRAGMRPDTRSGLWTHMAYAVSQLRPRYVIAENVRGLLSASADSDLEPCPWCVGGSADGEPDLRALGAVLGDLAELGYDAQWTGLRAADVGAPHGRFRVFILATDTEHDGLARTPLRRSPSARSATRADRQQPLDAKQPQRTHSDSTDTEGEPGSIGHGDDVRARRGTVGRGQAAGGSAAADSNSLGRQRRGPARYGRQGPTDGSFAVADADGEPFGTLAGSEREAIRREWSALNVGCGSVAAPDASGQRHGRGKDGRSLGRVDSQTEGETRERERARAESGDRGAAVAADAASAAWRGTQPEHLGSPVRSATEPRERASTSWGAYEPAIRRWQRVLGRVAPAPTETSARGSQRLSPRFVEWMQGLEPGWVTDVPDLSRNAQLKALGNGVVPQQAYAAIAQMLNVGWVAA